MSTGRELSIALCAAILGALIVPAFARNSAAGGTQNGTDQRMGMSQMGGGMMRGGTMSRGMMGGGCSEMMQSMNNGGGRPNTQWQQHPPRDPDNAR